SAVPEPSAVAIDSGGAGARTAAVAAPADACCGITAPGSGLEFTGSRSAGAVSIADGCGLLSFSGDMKCGLRADSCLFCRELGLGHSNLLGLEQRRGIS